MELWHAMNRGTDKRTIFYDSQDYSRFVHNLYEMNDVERVLNSGRKRMSDLVGHSLQTRGPNQLVDIHAWCLMRNHFHILLSERAPNGISNFLMKVNVGYAKYFNEKYKRSGTLFQGRTKKVLIESDGHYLHILNYIHLNPLDYHPTSTAWRTQTIRDASSALKYLDSYRWSSYLDYASTENFPSIITQRQFGDPHYRTHLKEYLKHLEPDALELVALE